MFPTFRKCTLLLFAFLVLIILFIRYILYNEQSSSVPPYRQRLATNAPIIVSVFYEALCSDSKHFIQKQLEPTYNKASSIMDIQFIPYGKATTIVNADGTYKFDCQHGPAECSGNKYHACTVELLEDAQMRLNMVACMIKDNGLPKEAFQRCVRQFSLDNEKATLIQKCWDSSLGDTLLKVQGDATNALRPEISFIPTVTLDGAQGQQAAILKDLFGELCKIAGHNPNSAEICQK